MEGGEGGDRREGGGPDEGKGKNGRRKEVVGGGLHVDMHLTRLATIP